VVTEPVVPVDSVGRVLSVVPPEVPEVLEVIEGLDVPEVQTVAASASAVTTWFAAARSLVVSTGCVVSAPTTSCSARPALSRLAWADGPSSDFALSKESANSSAAVRTSDSGEERLCLVQHVRTRRLDRLRRGGGRGRLTRAVVRRRGTGTKRQHRDERKGETPDDDVVHAA
jgi:hypothetical protein